MTVTINESSIKCWAQYQVCYVLIQSFNSRRQAVAWRGNQGSEKPGDLPGAIQWIRRGVGAPTYVCPTRKPMLSTGYPPFQCILWCQFLNFHLLAEISLQFMNLYLSQLQSLCCWYIMLPLTNTNNTHGEHPLPAMQLALNCSTSSSPSGPIWHNSSLGTSI